MSVLLKYQLKALFESGDLMTQDTLVDLIDSTYNPVLVAGTNVTLNSVTTPSGTTITINSTGGGGGGGDYQAGTGINIDTATSPDTINVNLFGTGPGGPNLQFSGANNQLDFKGVHVKDESIVVGTYPIFNFVGQDVVAEDSGTAGQVNVYIPTPSFASHYNTTDGTTTGTVNETLSRSTVRISTPTTEGNPFKTGGWAGTDKPATIQTTPVYSPIAGANGLITGFSGSSAGDAILEVFVYDADGSTLLASYTTPTLYQNDVHTSIGANAGITVTITNHATDTSKFKANISTSVNMATIFTTNTLDGGKYNVKTVMTTDTNTDGGTAYTALEAAVFYDTNLSTPSINGAMTIVENTGALQVKHLSGVEYYKLGSQFMVDITDMDNLNANTQGYANGVTRNFRITGTEYGLTSYNLKAWLPSQGSMVGWTNQYNVQDVAFDWDSWPITAVDYRYRGALANGTAVSSDPWGNSAVKNSGNKLVLIDTVDDLPTNLGESFNNESERLVRGSSAYAAWNSTLSLADGTQTPNGTGSGSFSNACTVGSYIVRADKYFMTDPNTSTIEPDLALYKPNSLGTNPNYTGITGTGVYHRRFYTSSVKTITNVRLDFAGDAGTSGSNFGQAIADSKLRIYIRRIATNASGNVGFSAAPLSVHGGLYDSGLFNDGNSGVDSTGSLVRTVTNPLNVSFTFGGPSTLAVTGFWAEIQLVDSTIELESINVTLTFGDNTTESNPV